MFPNQRDANDGIFNLMDPAIIQQQEQASRQASDQAALQRQLAMPVGDQARALMFQGATDLGRAMNPQAQQESPSVARARILKEAWAATSGEVDTDKRLEAMEKVLDNQGLLDDAAKLRAARAKIALDKANVGKVQAETRKIEQASDPKVKMDEYLKKLNISPIDRQKYLESWDGTRFTSELPLAVQTENTYGKVEEGENGSRYQTIKSGKDAGKRIQITAPKAGPLVSISNANYAPAVDKTISTGLDERKALGEEIKTFETTARLASEGLQAVRDFNTNPTSANSTKVMQLYARALTGGSNQVSKADYERIEAIGGVIDRTTGVITGWTRGTISNNQMLQVAQTFADTFKQASAAAQKGKEDYQKFQSTSGRSGNNQQFTTEVGSAVGTSPDIRKAVAGETTNPKVRRVQDPVQYNKRASDLARDNEAKNKRSSDPKVSQGNNGKVRYDF